MLDDNDENGPAWSDRDYTYEEVHVFSLTCSVFLLSYRNRSGSLGEQEILWEHELIGECFHNFLKFSQTFTSVSITQWKTYFLCFYRVMETLVKVWENLKKLQKTCFLFLLENTGKKKH